MSSYSSSQGSQASRSILMVFGAIVGLIFIVYGSAVFLPQMIENAQRVAVVVDGHDLAPLDQDMLDIIEKND